MDVASDELRRFLGAVERGELWEQRRGRWWRLPAAHGRALVRAADGGDGWVWAVQCPVGGAITQGRSATEVEARRVAERVLEEHRPEG